MSINELIKTIEKISPIIANALDRDSPLHHDIMRLLADVFDADINDLSDVKSKIDQDSYPFTRLKFVEKFFEKKLSNEKLSKYNRKVIGIAIFIVSVLLIIIHLALGDSILLAILVDSIEMIFK